MKKLTLNMAKLVTFSILFGLIISVFDLSAQPTPTFFVNYDFFEYNHLKDPDANLKDSEIRVGTLNLAVSYPFISPRVRLYLQMKSFINVLILTIKNFLQEP